MEREILEIIRKRKSVRKFSDRTISDVQIKTLLEAGQQAPSVRNGQPWQYIVPDFRRFFQNLVLKSRAAYSF